MLTTLLRPDSGQRVRRRHRRRSPTRARRGRASASPVSTPRSRNASPAARTSSTSPGCSTCPDADGRRRAAELLERFDLVDAGERVVMGYSGGMRRRLDIAMSLIARPAVLFLDEPTTGLDPRSRLAMWDLIEELGSRGHHHASSPPSTSTRPTRWPTASWSSTAARDRRGHRRRAQGPHRRRPSGGHDRLDGQPGAAPPRPSRRSSSGASRPRLDEPVLYVPIHAGGRRRTQRHPGPRRLLGVSVVDVEVRRPSLDDVFLTLTGASPDDFAQGAAAS